MEINKKELVQKAMECKTADELMVLAKTEGFAVTQEEAEAYLAELADVELDGEQLKKVAGGDSTYDCNTDNDFNIGGWCPRIT
ncbi:MAG: hypothetical protein IKZ43_04150 [Acidaminococcaceae bacterium]|nr:hypothetical protein [Acidaminococcaceae bacterium]